MIIDLILDRKDGDNYNARNFYNEVREYEQIFNFSCNISGAMDEGTEEDVKDELCKYIVDNEYNTEICDYVRSVNWLEEQPEQEQPEQEEEDEDRKPLTADEINAHKLTDDDAPALYVGTYGKYAGGSIFGMWIDLTTFADAEEFVTFCRRLHHDEEDPELMAQDFMNFPRKFYCESVCAHDLESLYEFLEMDEDEREMCAEYWDEIDESADAAKIVDSMVYHGDFDEYADEMADEMMDCNGGRDSVIARYFDYGAWRRDLSFDYHITSNYVFTAY